MLETDRRVLANLSEPVSLMHLTDVFMKSAHGPFDVREGYASVEEDVAKVLDKLVRQGLATNLGEVTDTGGLQHAVNQGETIDWPDSKRERLVERMESGRDVRHRHPGGLFMMSPSGFEALHAPLPGSEEE